MTARLEAYHAASRAASARCDAGLDAIGRKPPPGEFRMMTPAAAAWHAAARPVMAEWWETLTAARVVYDAAKGGGG